MVPAFYAAYTSLYAMQVSNTSCFLLCCIFAMVKHSQPICMGSLLLLAGFYLQILSHSRYRTYRYTTQYTCDRHITWYDVLNTALDEWPAISLMKTGA